MPEPKREGIFTKVEKKEEVPDVLPEERPEEYLNRVTLKLLGGKYGLRHYGSGLNVQREEENQPNINAAVEKLLEERAPKTKFSETKNEQVFREIEASIQQASVSLRYDVKDGDPLPYAKTTQNRKFFGKAEPLGSKTPNSHSLFCLGLESPVTSEYLQHQLNGKTIYLLGGGDSIVDLIASEDIKPKLVVNIDPYIGSESVEKSGRPYLSINQRVEDTSDVINSIKDQDLPLADEIWASYSVPYYFESPDQIEGMFNTITSLLAEGGTARITPLYIQNPADGSYEDNKNTLLDEVEKLIDSPNFNVYIVNNEAPTLFIERLSVLKGNSSSQQ